jgi:hypothetical protein
MTIEEREAAYNEARSRIFMGFEDKEKGKEMNATPLHCLSVVLHHPLAEVIWAIRMMR